MITSKYPDWFDAKKLRKLQALSVEQRQASLGLFVKSIDTVMRELPGWTNADRMSKAQSLMRICLVKGYAATFGANDLWYAAEELGIAARRPPPGGGAASLEPLISQMLSECAQVRDALLVTVH